MNLLQYLPSSQFSVIASSIAISGGLIIGAYYFTRPPAPPTLQENSVTASQNAEWQAALEKVQAEAPGLPEPPNPEEVAALRAAAKDSNVTSSVAKSLLVNLTEAGAQGLGSDIPTQEKLIADAAAQAQANSSANLYTSSDLTIAGNSAQAAKTWGNGVMRIFAAHPGANDTEALYAIAYATDYQDAASVAKLSTISKGYAALAADLADLPVPSTYAPLYLNFINNMARMSGAAGDMKMVLEDPLRGLTGLQVFQSAAAEGARVLTTLADQLSKGGILFTKDEPGNTWNVLVSTYTQ